MAKFEIGTIIEKIDSEIFVDPYYEILEITGGCYRIIESVFETDKNGNECCVRLEGAEPIWKTIEEIDLYYKDSFGSSPINYKYNLLTRELTEL